MLEEISWGFCVPLSFTTQMMRIGDLFADASVFDMPDFQRPFCWDEETAAQLYDDIHAAMVRGAPTNGRRKNLQEYFLGPIIITRKRVADPAEVIDGQQRLVVLTILLALIRDALPEDNRLRDELHAMIVREPNNLRNFDGRPRLFLRRIDKDAFVDWVQRSGGTRELPEDHEQESCARILDAIKHIKDDIGNCQIEYLTKLAQFILNNCYVIQIRARDLDDGYILFKSLNSRGQPLSELDLCKAELLGPAPPAAGIDKAQLARQWEKAETSLEREAFEEYVHSVLSLIARNPHGRDLRDLMREVLSNPVEANNFRYLLASVLRHAADLEDGTLDFGNDSQAINRVVACLESYPINEWRSVALQWLARSPDGFSALRFFTALDGLCLGLLILSKSKAEIMRRFKAVAREIALEGEAVLGHAGKLRFSPQEQTQIQTVLNKPISSRKKFLKPLLLRLNAKRLPVEMPLFFPEGLTIEHILPRNPKAESPWMAKFPDAAVRKNRTELLGNYALLTHKINAGAKNKDFREKRQIMFGKTDNHAFPITSDLINFDDWTEDELLRRHQVLVTQTLELLGVFSTAVPRAAE
ncbi:MAG: DUF262 domain-containing protein [Methyloligella sp. ZOD6]